MTNKLSKTGITTLKRRYQSVLLKCLAINAGMFMLSAPAMAEGIAQRVVVSAGETGTIEENLTNFNNPDLTGGAVQNSGILNVDDGVSFESNTAHAGGVIYSTGTQLNIGNNVSFTNNTTAEGQDAGAALYAMGGKTATNVVIGDNVKFNQNKSHQKAGAVFLEDANLTIGNDAIFEGNSSAQNAGVIYNWNYLAQNSKTTIGENVVFKNNTAGANAGVIANYDGDITIGENSIFESNKASENGGAILNQNYLGTSKLTVGNNATFLNNTALQGGAVSNSGNITIGENSLFQSNTAVNAGAIDSEGQTSSLTIGNRTKFENNTSDNYAGAILFRHGTMIVGDDVEFTGNKSGVSGEKHSGGAVVIDSNNADATGSASFGKNSTFTKNESTNSGGALYMYESAGRLALTVGEGASFAENFAAKNGGAFAVYGATDGVSFGNNASFDSNTASENGGALYLSDWGDDHKASITFAEGATFTDNKAGTLGGAIYNSGTLTFDGASVFSGNTDSFGANDIYNEGTINFNGNTTLDGGISGEGEVVFADGTNLTIAANKTTIANNVSNNGATLNLTVEKGYTGTYQLVTGTLDNEFKIAENNLYNIVNSTQEEAIVKGSYEISKKSNEEIAQATGADSNEAAVLNAVTNQTETENALFNTIAQNINKMAQSNDAAIVKKAIDAAHAFAPETAPVVQQVATENANQVFSAVGSRLSGGSGMDNRQGMSSGDANGYNGAVWAQMLYNKSKYDKTSDTKFDADTKGVAFGLEKYFNPAVKAGIGYAYSKTDVDGFMRDTDIKTHTAIVYGEYKPSNWFVNGIVTYGWSDYDEKKNVSGNRVKADYDVDALAMQAMTGYDMNINGYGITPETGLRYIHIKQDKYTDAAGQRVDSDDIDIVTGVIGARVNKTYAYNNMLLKPELKAAMTYDFANDDTKSVVSLINGSSYAVQGKALKRFGVELGAGLTAEVNNNVELSLGYEGKFRKDYQDHTGLINAKYKF